MVMADGVRMSHASRNHVCPSSSVYRYAKGIVSVLAHRYGDHPALKLWHVNNEYCEVCHCDGPRSTSGAGCARSTTLSTR
ncbi:MAG: beta-galactosidase [Pseudonocardiales bacterium]|jgi:beta-galactosidase|nr:beta-galactosidase [Pseudonocardiales bacterium]